MNINDHSLQNKIIDILRVTSTFNVDYEYKKRLDFIKDYLRMNKLKTLVLGISGGIDSTVAGRLAQIAVEELRAEAYPAHFIAVRLPYGHQVDEGDAQAALKFIKADQVFEINIKPSCDALIESMKRSNHQFISEAQEDFVLGNIKARQRMIVQYALAGANDGLVIGTDHAAEAVMGFFTKYGDGACDIAPLNGLTKGRVRKLGTFLGAESYLVNKKPMADLENLNPQQADEEVYGITYNQIDDFLEGKAISAYVYEKITSTYLQSEHKRQLPIVPN